MLIVLGSMWKIIFPYQNYKNPFKEFVKWRKIGLIYVNGCWKKFTTLVDSDDVIELLKTKSHLLKGKLSY